MKSAIKRLLCSRSGVNDKNRQRYQHSQQENRRREPEGRPDDDDDNDNDDEDNDRLSDNEYGNEQEYGIYTPLRSELQKALRNSGVGHHLKYQHKVRSVKLSETLLIQYTHSPLTPGTLHI